MNGIGNGGVSTDGLVFLVDSLNKKSFKINDSGIYVTDTATYTPYYGLSPSVVIGLTGNLGEWGQYLVNSDVTAHLYGGSMSEDYIINGTIYDSSTTTTVLYNRDSQTSSVIYSCIMDDVWSGGPLLVTIPNFDASISLGIYSGGGGLTLSLTQH